MSLCYRDLSKKCEEKYRDCTDCVLEQIRTEIERQEKWLMDAGYNAYNTDIAFKAIKHAIAESEDKE